MAAEPVGPYNPSQSEMKRVVLTGPVVKVFTAFASIAGIGLFVYLMSGMPAPRESDRVTSADGEISIIKPRDWNASTVYPPAGALYGVVITSEPVKAVGAGPRLMAARFRNPPVLEELKKAGLQPGQFRGRDAMIMAQQVKRDFFWRAVFEEGGNWYEVVLRLDAPENVPGSSWWPYITSFRAGKPTTHPSGA